MVLAALLCILNFILHIVGEGVNAIVWKIPSVSQITRTKAPSLSLFLSLFNPYSLSHKYTHTHASLFFTPPLSQQSSFSITQSRQRLFNYVEAIPSSSNSNRKIH